MKQDVATRFDNLLIMLQSMAAELAMSIKLLKKRKQEECACAILCILASSSMSECTFLFASNTRTNKRNALKPNTLNALLYLRSN